MPESTSTERHHWRRILLVAVALLATLGGLFFAQTASASDSSDSSINPQAVDAARLTVVLEAVPESSQVFSFDAFPTPLTGFTLVDDGGTNYRKIFSNITKFTMYTITEVVPNGWDLDHVKCVNDNEKNSIAPTGSPDDDDDDWVKDEDHGVSVRVNEGDDITCTFKNVRFGSEMVRLSIDKTASSATYTAAGQVITYTYKVTNIDDHPLGKHQMEISDDRIDGSEPFDCGEPVKLDPDDSVTCTANYTITAADIIAGSVKNTAFATFGEYVSEDDSVTITYLAPTTTTAAPTTTKAPTTTVAPTTAAPTTTVASAVFVGAGATTTTVAGAFVTAGAPLPTTGTNVANIVAWAILIALFGFVAALVFSNRGPRRSSHG